MTAGTMMGIALLALIVIILAVVAGIAHGALERQGEKSKEPHPHDVGTRFE